MSDPASSRLESSKIQAGYRSSVGDIAGQLNRFAQGMHPVAADFMGSAASMQEHVADVVRPFNVAVFGRMKTGKSSLINALVGRRLAVTGVDEATATINRLTFASGAEQLGNFKVHWLDASPESFPVSQLKTDWNGKEPEVLARIKRVKYLELFADAEWLRDVQVTDTPGTGSTASEHEDVAQQFINGKSSDALIYVFPPVGRETDGKDLESYRRGCLPGSTPYNSVAVLHKWDDIFWGNGGDWGDICAKAARLHEQMSSLVAEVVPVSGPLALVAQAATPDFWDAACGLLATFPDEGALKGVLMADRLWKIKPAQGSLYERAHEDYDMPWASFRIMLRELYRRQCRTAEDARSCITALSGIDNLRKTLDKRFFKQAAIIHLRRTRSLVRDDVEKIRMTMHTADEALAADSSMLDEVANALNDERLRRWVENRALKLHGQRQSLRAAAVKIDRLICETQHAIQLADDAVELVPWLEENASLFTDRCQVAELVSLLRDGVPIPMEHFEALYRHVSGLAQHQDIGIRAMGRKLQAIVMNSVQ